MNETLSYALAALVLPPTSTAVLALAGLWLMRPHVCAERARTGRALVLIALVALLVLSMPAVGTALLRTLEPPPVDVTQARAAQAIIVLGGGRSRGALEWGGETVNHQSLQRMRYGAYLAQQLSLPLLVTGGTPGRGTRSEAALMRDLAQHELHTEVRWVEEQSLHTRDNARLSAQTLPPQVRSVILVTSASHMRRAQANFQAQGFTVWPAATDYQGQWPFAWNLLIPSVEGLARSCAALREWLAIFRDRFSS